MILYPRLSKLAAECRYEEIRGLSVKQLHVSDVVIPDEATFAQTGGHRISPEQLSKFRQSVVKIAQRFGFPDSGDERTKAEFDAICAVWMRKQAGIDIGEGSRDEVWAFLTIELMPDVAAFLARRKIPALVVKPRKAEPHRHDGEPFGVVEDVLVNSHPVSEPVAGGIGERSAAFVHPRAWRLSTDAKPRVRRHLQDRPRLVRQGFSERIVAAFPAGTNTRGKIVER